MGSISIRGMNDELAALLKEAASSEKKSVNQFVLETLKKQVGLTKEKRFSQEWHDLDSLFGKWSEEEFLQIQRKIDDERQIDEELWK
ncbi:MAG: antitoxin [Desulfobulbaceae bacterium BRH_c16a]|nr:MAG: antitoxin [Desulfobulbaceae bacterium BRH_c16a]